MKESTATKAFSNNMCQLPAKTTFYFANGSGRDAYIYKDNGGLCLPNMTKTQFESGIFPNKRRYGDLSPRIPPKGIHYHSDGTGRDSYVVISSGGMHRDTVAGEFKNNFYHSLRTYPKVSRSYSPVAPRGRDKMYTTMTAFKTSKWQDIYRYQQELDKRLSVPKRPFKNQKD